jgi:uncharacterized membrane protein
MDKKLYWSIIVVSVIGIAISIYMTVFKLTNNNAMCLGNGGCSTVNASRYSEIYGIPVAVLGLAGYFAIVAALFLESRLKFFAQNGNLLAFGMSLTGVLFTVYLTYLEIYVIKAICPFCVASAIAISLVFILTLTRLVRSETKQH